MAVQKFEKDLEALIKKHSNVKEVEIEEEKKGWRHRDS